MATREQVVQCARSWIGTRWQHQAHLKGVACDCAGLVIEVGREVFGILADVPAYGHTPHANTMRRICDRYLVRVSIASMAPGDVLLMSWADEPHHMAIVSIAENELGIIHSYAQARGVVEHRLDDQWRARIRAVYAFPELA